MDLISVRVAARYLRQLMADEEAEPSKGGVPPRWQEWLDAEHSGGQKKVPNPNSETRGRFPQVSFSTALKDPAVFQKAIKDYHEWVGKNPEKKKTTPDKAAPKEDEKTQQKPAPAAPKKPAKQKAEGPDLKGPMAVTDADLDAIIEKHKKAFDAMKGDMRAEVADYMKKFKTQFKGEKVPEYAVKEFEALSEQEKMIHVAGHRVGELFEKSLTPKERQTHEDFTDSWLDSSSNEESMEVHGALGSLGVEGSQTAKDKTMAKSREAGKKKEDLKKVLGKSYAFTQAYFRHIGLKEMTLFRGVMSPEADKAKDGDEISMETRELSSFSSDPRMVALFGRPIKMKVPVQNILWSNLSSPGFGSQKPPSVHGESEIAVMGASKLSGTVIGKADKKLTPMGVR